MTEYDSEGFNASLTTDVQNSGDDGIGPFAVPESDLSAEDFIESLDVDTSGEMTRIDPLPGDVEE